MAHPHVTLPPEGDKITMTGGKSVVADHPIVGYVEGDGIEAGIMRAILRVWDGAVAVDKLPVGVVTQSDLFDIVAEFGWGHGN